MKTILIIHGGWEGHVPQEFTAILEPELSTRGFQCTVRDSLDALLEKDLPAFDLVQVNWTMGELPAENTKRLSEAVRAGTGLAGIHGGMGDAFRGNIDFEWMVGGHFLGHPHVGPYAVRLSRPAHPVCHGLPARFDYESEQYYLMVDPAVEVLAETTYARPEGEVAMPVAWTRRWGEGRVFYSALGHDPKEYRPGSPALQLALQGFEWAAR
jgi:type 1 glutamine amidotransferase